MVAAQDPDKNSTPPTEAEYLRRRAEILLDELADDADDSPAHQDISSLLHELHVHQIELEMQNEQLRDDQRELDEQRAKWSDLFELAPVGYLALNAEGIVCDANLTAIHLLGLEQQSPVGQSFDAFVFPKDRDTYYLHVRALEKSGGPRSCELRLYRLLNTVAGEIRDAGQRHFWARLESRLTPAAHDETLTSLVTFTDISERKQAEAALSRSEQRYRSILGSSPDGVSITDLEGRVLMVSPAALKMFGFAREDEMVGRPIGDFAAPEDRESAAAGMARMLEGVLEGPTEYRALCADGSTFHADVNSEFIRDADGQPTGMVFTVRDITERKRQDDELRLSAERRQTILQTAMDGFWLLDMEGHLLEVNEAYCGMSGYDEQELLGMRIADLEAREATEDTASHMQKVITEGADRFESRHRRKDGSVFDIEISVQYQPADEGRMSAFLRDITERNRAEAALHDLSWRMESVIAGSHVGTWEWNVQTGETVFSERWAEIVGYTLEELTPISIKTWEALADPDDLGRSDELLERHFAGELPYYNFESRMKHKDGHWIWVADRGRVITRTDDGKPLMMAGTHADITERKNAEVALAESAASHLAILRTAMDGFWLVDTEGRLLEVNEAYCRESGYSEQELLTMNIADLVAPGTIEDIAPRIQRAVAEGGLRFEARPRRKDGSFFDAEVSVQYQSADGGRVASFIHDITERKQSEKALSRALSSIIDVVSQVVETRDPYTAGHQRRVSQVAVAIAQEMGMAAEQIEEIRIAALIHDVGKMSVPAEILSKPGQLSPMEFGLIKGHAEASYRIIVSANMEGPVAEIVYQHHERCDGTGYPRGLEADELLAESKVLMVADVVEAMVSHRPYRAALGIDAALAEIERGAGTVYDAAVAGSCLRIFQENGFAFSEV